MHGHSGPGDGDHRKLMLMDSWVVVAFAFHVVLVYAAARCRRRTDGRAGAWADGPSRNSAAQRGQPPPRIRSHPAINCIVSGTPAHLGMSGYVSGWAGGRCSGVGRSHSGWWWPAAASEVCLKERPCGPVVGQSVWWWRVWGLTQMSRSRRHVARVGGVRERRGGGTFFRLLGDGGK